MKNDTIARLLLVVGIAGLTASSLVPSRLQGLSPIQGEVPTYAQLNKTGETTWTLFKKGNGLVDGVRALVLKEATFATEAGPIMVIYGQIRQAGNPEEVVKEVMTNNAIGTVDGEDTKLVVLVDAIEDEVDRRILKIVAEPQRWQNKPEILFIEEFAGKKRDEMGQRHRERRHLS